MLPGWGRELPDAVIVRGLAGGSFERVTKRLAVLHLLARHGVPVYNDARAIERSVDKATTSVLLHAAGVPTPPAWAFESIAEAQRLVMREGAAGRALVLKPVFGSQGKGLARCGLVDGVPVALPAPAVLAQAPYGGLVYLQRYVPPVPGDVPGPAHDWRVMVIGGVARAAMRRCSTHWVHNVAQGARCAPQPLDDGAGTALARIAVAAAAALGLDYAGVDLIPSPDGPLVLEVNGVAAWRGLQGVTPFNLARAIVDDLIDRKHARLVPARSA